MVATDLVKTSNHQERCSHFSQVFRLRVTLMRIQVNGTYFRVISRKILLQNYRISNITITMKTPTQVPLGLVYENNKGLDNISLKH